MELDKKKRKLITTKNIIIVVMSIIIALVGIVLSFVFGLYSQLGTIGGIILNALVFFGAFGALEIDDWTIWLKRLIIKKYHIKKGNLIIKAYRNSNLEKKYLSIPFLPLSYNVTNDQTIVWDLVLSGDHDGHSYFSIHCTINPITNGVTITDMYGNTYKVGKEQYCKSGKRLDIEMDKFNEWLNLHNNFGGCSINPDSLTVEIEK